MPTEKGDSNVPASAVRKICADCPQMLSSLGAPKPGERGGIQGQINQALVGLQLPPTTGNPFFISGQCHLVSFVYTEHFAH